MAAYTDADVLAACAAFRGSSFRYRTDEALMHAVLREVAPVIAARALREAADALADRGFESVPYRLRDRADEIERTP